MLELLEATSANVIAVMSYELGNGPLQLKVPLRDLQVPSCILEKCSETIVLPTNQTFQTCNCRGHC